MISRLVASPFFAALVKPSAKIIQLSVQILPSQVTLIGAAAQIQSLKLAVPHSYTINHCGILTMTTAIEPKPRPALAGMVPGEMFDVESPWHYASLAYPA